MAKRKIQELNAGSMADIAFLLLIFWLTTTTMDSDKGISIQLPPYQPENIPPPPIKQKNVLEVLVNANDMLLVENEYLKVSDLYEKTVEHINNNGKSPVLSENPIAAVVSLQNDRETSYNAYIQVYNEIIRAYTTVRNQTSQSQFGKKYDELSGKKQKIIRKMIPRNLSESEPIGKK